MVAFFIWASLAFAGLAVLFALGHSYFMALLLAIFAFVLAGYTAWRFHGANLNV